MHCIVCIHWFLLVLVCVCAFYVRACMVCECMSDACGCVLFLVSVYACVHECVYA
jgi:hypothetical protein